ncbi:AAA domain-containing protein [Dactylosporangium sp. NPDC050688]|uniref:AAA domain-containing protein n=1 Tax=Dactylosporangium sp. NPDC050688 TaxID=3157217 RepID=UPI00340F457B
MILPDWRDEVCGALDFWINSMGGSARDPNKPIRVGRARQQGEPGWYAVDLRDSRADADHVESFRLAGPEKPSTGGSYQVMEAIRDGPVLRVRVAEFVDLANAFLWQQRQPATHLLVKLREGIAGLGDAGLANDLALGRLAPPPDTTLEIAGFTTRQKEAVASCLAPGVRLVWGPPGTGKTRVLSEAISILLASGARVLLVSSTNIAVDNALLGVAGQRRHQQGDLLRVGPPHHPGVLDHPDICLPQLVRERLAQVEDERRQVERKILQIQDREAELARLEQATAGFSESDYRRVKALIAAETDIRGLAQAVTAAQDLVRTRARDVEGRLQKLHEVSRRLADMQPARSAYLEIDTMQHEISALVRAADALSGQALTARHEAEMAESDLRRLMERGLFARMRAGSSIQTQQAKATVARLKADRLTVESEQANALVERRRAAMRRETSRWTSSATCSRANIAEAEHAATEAERAHVAAQVSLCQAENELDSAQQILLAAEARPRATDIERAMVIDADEGNLPTLAQRAEVLRKASDRARPVRTSLEQQHAKVQDQFERLRRDAEGELIRRAKVVATTLARLRTNKVLMDGPYDVVLVDEVGAANIPEVLLAVSRATRSAVLLGDFMQLGAITNTVVDQASRPDIERWLQRDIFEHCGITTPTDAQARRGCTALDVQHRFGPDIMGLANAVAYGGMLRPGPNVQPHAADDPEVVFIDVDGLGDLAQVRATGGRKGWWPAGALISRVLADYHRIRGERVGIVTPYTDQVEASLEALRDQEGPESPPTEVGTAHRFQGREFPIVIFDLVEDEFDRRWMASATTSSNKWARDGVRLFNVGVTRTQTRLYFIGSRKQVNAAPADTPLAHVSDLMRTRRARTVSATRLITPTGTPLPVELGPFTREFAEILATHVRVDDIHDEHNFYEVFASYLRTARRSLWIWAPWTANRVRSLLPLLADAKVRGVSTVIFVRDPRDDLQRKVESQKHLADLRRAVDVVVEMNVMHQKIVVIDEEVVLLGSLNVLSQSWTREVMLAMRGSHFARKLLEYEHAAEFSSPPRCGECHGNSVDLRRRSAGDWYWRCYSEKCPKWTPGGRRNWTTPALDNKRKIPRQHKVVPSPTAADDARRVQPEALPGMRPELVDGPSQPSTEPQRAAVRSMGGVADAAWTTSLSQLARPNGTPSAGHPMLVY